MHSKAVWCGFGDYILHWVLSVVVFKKNKIIIIIGSRKGTMVSHISFHVLFFSDCFHAVLILKVHLPYILVNIGELKKNPIFLVK